MSWKKNSILGLIFSLAFANAFFYTVHTAYTYLYADEWRHFKTILIPLIEGNASWSVIFKNHHPYPLLHIIQLLNIQFFSYHPEYHAFLGLFFQGVTGIVFILYFLHLTNGKLSEFQQAFFCIAISIILFGFNSTIVYSWPLIGISQVIFFFAIILYIFTDRYFQQQSAIPLIAALACCIFLLFCNGDSGILFIGAVFVLLFVAGLLNKRLLVPAFVFLMPIILYSVFLYFIKIPELHFKAVGVSTSFISLFNNIPDLLLGYSIGLLSGLVNISLISKQFPWAVIPLQTLSVLIAVFQLIVITLYIRRIKHYESIMPLILTVFGFIFFLSISLFRYQPGENAYWIFAIPRYGSISRLPIIGLVWALTFIWPEYKRLSKLLKSFAGVAFIFFTVLILFLLSLQTVCAWKQSRFVQNSNERKYVSLYMASLGDEGALKLPRSIVGNNANLDVVLNFIKQHELNILSQGKPKSIFLQNFKKNRSLYISDSSSSVHSIQFDSTNGKWKQESTSVSIHNNRMIIENNRESPIVAKIVIQSEYYAPKALRIFETDPRIMKIVDVLNGTQAYYFSILSKKKINLVVFGNVRFYSASLKETFK